MHAQACIQMNRPAATAARGWALQRKCACGQHTVAGAKCEACSSNETEARLRGDRAGVPSIVSDVLRSPGRPLDAVTRSEFESRLDQDFSGVRVHAGAEAGHAARAIDALAFTAGRNVVFGAGQYAPQTKAGRRLLGHELGHVMQQRGIPNDPSAPLRINDDRAAESEADRIASIAMNEEAVAAPLARTVPAGVAAIQRQTASPDAGAGYFTDVPNVDSGPCLEPYTGGSIETLLKAGTVTVVEFSATWCNPCHALQGFLQGECSKRKTGKKPFKFYTVDIDVPGNAAIRDKYAAKGVPQLYVFDGTTQAYHGDSVQPMDFYAKLFDGLMFSASDVPETGKMGLPRWATIGGGAVAGMALAGITMAIAAAAKVKVSTEAAFGILGGAGVAGGLLGLWDPFGLSERTRPVGLAEADKLIGEQFGKNIQKGLVGATLWAEEAGLPKARINIADAATFCAAYVALHKDPGNPYSAIAAKSQCDQKLSGFVDSSTKPDTVWINSDRANPGTVVHEGLHLYSPEGFGQRFQFYANEGVTEYFTRQITDRERIERKGRYDSEFKEVTELVGALGDEKPLRDAYFGGKVAELFAFADGKLGKGKLDAWQQAMETERWADARQALRK